jgi:hypothetical protein
MAENPKNEPLNWQSGDENQRRPQIIRRRMRDLVSYEILGLELERYGEISDREKGAISGLSFFAALALAALLQLLVLDTNTATAGQIAACWAFLAPSLILSAMFARWWYVASQKRPALLKEMTANPLPPVPDRTVRDASLGAPGSGSASGLANVPGDGST